MATRTLMIWPMLIAVVAVVALWLVISVLIYERGGYRPPLVLPALAIAVITAWNQTICWMPIKSKLVQVYSHDDWLDAAAGRALLLLVFEKVSPNVLTVIGLIELPVLCALAFLGLKHARRGDDWSFGLQELPDWFWRTVCRFSRQPSNFRTAAQAQLWYEDRSHAWVLKGVTYFQLLLIYMCAMTSPSRAGNKVTFSITLGCLVGTPFLLARDAGSRSGANAFDRVQATWVHEFSGRPANPDGRADHREVSLGRSLCAAYMVPGAGDDGFLAALERVCRRHG